MILVGILAAFRIMAIFWAKLILVFIVLFLAFLLLFGDMSRAGQHVVRFVNTTDDQHHTLPA
jgi:hypothetical protein